MRVNKGDKPDKRRSAAPTQFVWRFQEHSFYLNRFCHVKPVLLILTKQTGSGCLVVKKISQVMARRINLDLL